MATTKKPKKVVTKKSAALTPRTGRKSLVSRVTTIKPRRMATPTVLEVGTAAHSIHRPTSDNTGVTKSQDVSRKSVADQKPSNPVEDEHAGLDDLDPKTNPARDAKHFRRIIEARDQLARAEAELRTAVKDAHAAGDSWTVIGMALDTSRQAAFQRFGKD